MFLSLFITQLAFAADTGKPAPGFSLPDLNGKTVSLKQYLGKTVVLEWFNPGCPFVKYVHKDGEMKGIANKWKNKNVVWLAINSSAAGKQGHGVETNKKAKDKWKLPYPVLIDAAGKVGQAYSARTTPHMYVIDSKGILVYQGALDNAPRGNPKGGKKIAYVEDALADVVAGKKVRTSETKAYGCSVKY